MSQEINPVTQDMTAAVLAAQTGVLALLLAEMTALTQVMPGAARPDPVAQMQHEAEVEAAFDNMPV